MDLPFFEKMLIDNPSANTFAYIVATTHGEITRAPSGQKFIKVPVPKDVTIFKKNISICGFAGPLSICRKKPPQDYMRDLLENGIASCFPAKRDMEEFVTTIKDHDNLLDITAKLMEINPGLSESEAKEIALGDMLSSFGYKNKEDYIKDTCNVQSGKKYYANKLYTIIEADSSADAYPFNMVIIKKVRDPIEESKTITGTNIHYIQLGPFNLFDRIHLEELSRHILEKHHTAAKMARFQKILDKLNWPAKTSTLMTMDIFKIIEFLEINIAYIVDASCAGMECMDEGADAYELILPEDVGYGRKRKTRKKKKNKNKKQKTKNKK